MFVGDNVLEKTLEATQYRISVDLNLPWEYGYLYLKAPKNVLYVRNV